MGREICKVSVWEQKGIGNCSNNGITSVFDTLVIWDGPVGDPDAPQNAVILEERPRWGDAILVPVHRPEGSLGPMYGGTVAHKEYGPWPAESDNIKGRYFKVHDRFETPAEYRTYSA